MKKITVSKDKNPLDVLAQLGAETKNAWIYMHKNVVAKIRSLAYAKMTERDGVEIFNFNETITPPGRIVRVKFEFGDWYMLQEVTVAENIAFKNIPDSPDTILLLKMEE